MFFVHAMPKKVENAVVTSHFELTFCVWEKKNILAGKSHDYCDFMVCEELPFKVYSVQTKMQSWHFQILRFEEQFQKSSISVTGRKIAPTGANVTKFFTLATKS